MKCIWVILLSWRFIHVVMTKVSWFVFFKIYIKNIEYRKLPTIITAQVFFQPHLTQTKYNGCKSIVEPILSSVHHFPIAFTDCGNKLSQTLLLCAKNTCTKHQIEYVLAKNALPRFERVEYAPDLYCASCVKNVVFSLVFFAHFTYCSMKGNIFLWGDYDSYSKTTHSHWTYILLSILRLSLYNVCRY